MIREPHINNRQRPREAWLGNHFHGKTALSRQGMEVLTKAEVLSAENAGKGIHVRLSTKQEEKELIVERIFCLDRMAAIEELGVEKLGLSTQDPFLKVSSRWSVRRDMVKSWALAW